MSVNKNMDEDDQDLNNLYNQAFEFPQRVLDQVSECSPEGFLLFTVNENGEVELYTKTSADIIEAGLRSKALQVLKTMCTVEDTELTSQMLEQRNANDSKEDDEDFQ